MDKDKIVTRYRDYLYKQCLGSSIKTVSIKENIPNTTLERIFYSIAKEKEIEQLDELEETLRDEELVISLEKLKGVLFWIIQHFI